MRVGRAPQLAERERFTQIELRQYAPIESVGDNILRDIGIERISLFIYLNRGLHGRFIL